MKRKEFMQAYAGRIALTFLLLCLIVYTVFHAVGNSAGSLITSAAKEITDTRLLGGDGWIFREETLLRVSQAGLVNPIARGGTKVGKNAPLAEIWTVPEGTELATRQAELDALNQTIKLLENSLLPAGSTVADAQSYRAEALRTLQGIREAVETNNWTALDELEGRMLTLLNRYGALTGAEGAVEGALTKAKEERNALLTGARQTLINEQSSAYYYDRACVDGYEEIFTYAALQSLTVESFEALRKSVPQEEGFVVGKLCPSYTWYIAVPFADGAARFFEAGASYTARFPESHGEELTVACERILESEDGKNGAAVFRVDVTPAEFNYRRAQRVEITVGSISGYHIPTQAFHTHNGVTGVYIFDESTVCFRRISVIYEGEGYVIASLSDPEPTHAIAYIGPNDLVITSGKKLYDGKVYR